MHDPMLCIPRDRWNELKKKHNNAMMMFCYGNCYALFYADAALASDLCGMQQGKAYFLVPVSKSDEFAGWMRLAGNKVVFIVERVL